MGYLFLSAMTVLGLAALFLIASTPSRSQCISSSEAMMCFKMIIGESKFSCCG